MEDSGVEFHGFQTCRHRDEFVVRRSMSRLQKQAPNPLQIKSKLLSSSASAAEKSKGTASDSSSSISSSTSAPFSSFFSSKDPIPLLSPLVVFDSTSVGEENTTKSH